MYAFCRKGAMKDKLRTALRGGGSVQILINVWANGDFHLWVTEEWARLTAVKQSVITAEQLDAAEDPDAMIREELECMVEKAHLNYEVKGKPEPLSKEDSLC